MIHLSHRQAKAADRAAGLELIFPWPSQQLPRPTDLVEDEERDATEEEWEVARRLTGLPRRVDQPRYLIRRVAAVMLRRPPQVVRPRAVEPHLAVQIVTPRWYGATDPPLPTYSWVEASEGGEMRRRDIAAAPIASMRPHPEPDATPAALPQQLDYDGMPYDALCRAWRARRGLTLDQVTAITFVPRRTWVQWETEAGRPSARRPSPESAWRNYLRLLDGSQPSAAMRPGAEAPGKPGKQGRVQGL